MSWKFTDWLGAAFGTAAKIKQDHDAGKTASQIRAEIVAAGVPALVAEAEVALVNKARRAPADTNSAKA